MSGSLHFNSSSTNLVLFGQNKTIVWSSTTPTSLEKNQGQKPILMLLDSGNLVIIDEKNRNSETYLWQSFDYPSDTMLPGMKTGFNIRTGHTWLMTAWKSADDPCPIDLTCGMEPHAYPELSIRKGKRIYYRHGPWNGLRFSGTLHLRPNPICDLEFVHDDNEAFFRYFIKVKSIISRIIVNPTTSARERYEWTEAENSWSLYSSAPIDYCDSYGLCGVNGKCVVSSNPVCQCLKGFKPKSQVNWNSLIWAEGCERKTPLVCQNKEKDGFIKFANLKVPDTTNTWVNASMNLKNCRAKCLSNCSCVAYSNTDIREGGSGCVIWFGDLVDIREIPGGGQDVYIRMLASELSRGDHEVKALIFASVGVALSGILLACYFIRWRLCKEKHNRKNQMGGSKEEELELPIFDLSTISTATSNFSDINKLGEGGFGPVYKGKLGDGQEIAVKRLSMNSGQGVNEFKNEVVLIAKLQHRNLVKLLGCCIQEQERLLLYEYMSNKSLDFFIFDPKQAKLLEWPKRFEIICGIARGLLYLHQDSRLRIIHRDLKASNVLLDSELNPKISDFGLAKIFGGDQIEDKTNRVVGTYGYMAPEYVFHGLFSIKSDIFSFGIIVLEIVSGKRNRVFHPEIDTLALTGHAWKLMEEGRAIELLDECLSGSKNLCQVLRCIHVGLLCVQQNPMDRPSMTSIVMMLGSDSSMPQPKKPGYFFETESPQGGHSQSSTTNNATMSVLEPR
ncbi:G-type lectin S-receptor-like serine/threonine-protein kinase At4g27290 isoform X2 [Humulus lupulus]|nr:G-type lectin S-receptor-like serine/threonine-protein kinase At4g27290 isoform X2 [Humulus lupulus]XP_062079009.1 G-type lectin S-receptor-like serine/threonine-protein kinase At4g27290 isoform X2 [Humulus lupulus]XP_062079010.1 G-type lectin S-receptor-like serine/threonine-protein kinase At4g27290 isoform X2 [Humulus lupulus]